MCEACVRTIKNYFNSINSLFGTCAVVQNMNETTVRSWYVKRDAEADWTLITEVIINIQDKERGGQVKRKHKGWRTEKIHSVLRMNAQNER